MVGLFADLHFQVAICFLRRYPTSQAAAGLTQAKLAAFLRRIHYPGHTPVEVLLQRLTTAPAAKISQANAAGRAASAGPAIRSCARPGRLRRRFPPCLPMGISRGWTLHAAQDKGIEKARWFRRRPPG